jgi:hypothetical protein
MECGKTGVILAHRFQEGLFQEKSVLMSHLSNGQIDALPLEVTIY